MSNSAFQQRQTGNASEAGAGSVQKATPAEVLAGIDVGSSGAPLVVVPSLIPKGGLVEAYTAYEDIAKGDVVGLSHFAPGGSTQHYTHEVVGAVEEMGTTTWLAQKFTMPNIAGAIVVQIGVWGQNPGTPNPIATLRIRSSLTGPDLNVSPGLIVYPTSYYLWFTPKFGLIPGQDYYIIASDNNDTPGKGTLVRGTAITPLPGGERWRSVNAGASWTQDTADPSDAYNFRLVLGSNQSLGHFQIYKASAASSIAANRFSFFGYAMEAATAGNIVPVTRNKLTDVHTGLTAGRKYYLQDTNGQIGLTPGTVKIDLGRAINSTTLYRNRGASDHFGFAAGLAHFEGICGQQEGVTADRALQALAPVDYDAGYTSWADGAPIYSSEGGAQGVRVVPGCHVNSSATVHACMIYPES